MPLCSFAENHLMLGVTPVENLFIQEYLPHASGDYVRVYLYGLMQCYYPSENMTLERTAHILDLPEDTVKNAFQYWERQGIVRRISDNPIAYQYLNISSVFNEASIDQDIYRYRDFNHQLERIFGNRLLQSGEYRKTYEWIEDLGLPEEVVLIMVNAHVSSHGQKCQFKSLDNLAMKWAKKEIFTPEQAREEALKETDTWKLCTQVLKQMNIPRNPTKDEFDLAKKWLEEWKLSPKAVITACKETVKAINPSFGYLDTILKRNTDITSGAEMADALKENEATREAIKAIKEAMGLPASRPTPEEQENYIIFLSAGFEPETILRVAAYLAQKKPRSTELLFEYLEDFRKRGQLTSADIAAYLSHKKELRKLTRETYKIFGEEGEIHDRSTAQMEDWLKLASIEVIQYAAECARGKALPTGYITKLLNEWKKLDLTTVELAKRHMEAGRPAAPQTGAKPQQPTPNALNFQQRAYQEGELDYLFDKMNKYDDEEENHDAQ